MCHLCEGRFAEASKAVNHIIECQEEYREQVPERTQGQRVSDLANVFLNDLPLPPDTPPKSLQAIQNLALYLAGMTERVMEMKREGALP